MNNNESIDKIKLLKVLNIDFWVKKKLPKQESNKDNVNLLELSRYIIIQKSIKIKHEEIIKNFMLAAKNVFEDIKFETLEDKELLDSFQDKSSSKLKNVCLVMCDNNILEASSDIVNSEGKIINGNHIYLLNTLLDSKTITNDIKKQIWKDFLQIKDYE